MSIELLKDLISIPSVNPMGRSINGPDFLESRMSDYLVRFFEEIDVPVERVEIAPGRANVMAKLEGARDLPTILFDAHQDTVPVDDMTIAPFEPTLKNGRVYGRGACDVKGGMAAMLTAFTQIGREAIQRRPTVFMACTCDEEQGQIGAQHVVEQCQRLDRSNLLNQKPDMIVVAEPTDLDIVVAHRGATRWKIQTKGQAAHSSDPSKGVNAIYKMGHVLHALEVYAEILHRASKLHPLCGGSTLSVGRIEGGVSVNMVPPECSIEIDRRIVPGEDGYAVINDVEAYLKSHVNVDFMMLPPWTVGLPLNDTENIDLAQRIQDAAESLSHTSQIVGAGYGTHAARYDKWIAPSVVFGPGSIRQAHTKDEWIDIGQLEKAVEILVAFLMAS